MGNEKLKDAFYQLVKEWEEAFIRQLDGETFSDFIARKLIQLKAERDNWRNQALAEDERANRITDAVVSVERELLEAGCKENECGPDETRVSSSTLRNWAEKLASTRRCFCITPKGETNAN